jgi:hypothetical protein
MLFILFHERMIQKNFITISNKKESKDNKGNWIQDLIRGTLFAINSKKDFICIIEKDDNLSNFIKTKCLFYADLKQDIFEILIEKQIENNNYFIWTNDKGKLIAINCNWNLDNDSYMIQDNMPKWKQDAIFITSYTDVIIFKTNAISRTIDFIMKGKIIENINISDWINILKNIIEENHIDKNIIIDNNFKAKEL